MKKTVYLSFLLPILSSSNIHAQTEHCPNIVLIMADDFGYDDALRLAALADLRDQAGNG